MDYTYFLPIRSFLSSKRHEPNGVEQVPTSSIWCQLPFSWRFLRFLCMLTFSKRLTRKSSVSTIYHDFSRLKRRMDRLEMKISTMFAKRSSKENAIISSLLGTTPSPTNTLTTTRPIKTGLTESIKEDSFIVGDDLRRIVDVNGKELKSVFLHLERSVNRMDVFHGTHVDCGPK